MATGYIAGIARGMAGGQQQNPAFNQSTPWSNPTLDQGLTQQYHMYKGQNGPSQAQLDANNGGQGSVQWMNGPQGWGVYRSPTQAQQVLGNQQYAANQFQKNLPMLESQQGSMLNSNINQNMNSNLQGARSSNSARGMFYGGVNAGTEGAVRANASNQAATGRANINQGLINASNQLTGNAINTGFSYQQTQQALQDQVYQNAMAQLGMDTAMTNSVLNLTGSGAADAMMGKAGGMIG